MGMNWEWGHYTIIGKLTPYLEVKGFGKFPSDKYFFTEKIEIICDWDYVDFVAEQLHAMAKEGIIEELTTPDKIEKYGYCPHHGMGTCAHIQRTSKFKKNFKIKKHLQKRNKPTRILTQ